VRWWCVGRQEREQRRCEPWSAPSFSPKLRLDVTGAEARGKQWGEMPALMPSPSPRGRGSPHDDALSLGRGKSRFIDRVGIHRHPIVILPSHSSPKGIECWGFVCIREMSSGHLGLYRHFLLHGIPSSSGPRFITVGS
jgi:hypothetical protein